MTSFLALLGHISLGLEEYEKAFILIRYEEKILVLF
jgi:hypothetical protein